MFTDTHHDFGTVSRNAKTEYSFVFENCYEEDVHIVAVRSSCGCTKPLTTKTTVKSWEKAEIIAQFNTRSFIGTKSAMITVVFDRPYYAEVQLTVGGTIRSDIVVEPGEIRFGEVDEGSTRSLDLRISYAGRRDWKINDVRGNSDSLEVRLDPAQRLGNMISYMMHVKLKGNAPAGELQDEMVVITNDEKNEQFTLPVTAHIQPPITVSPPLVTLGEVHSGKPKQQRIIVRAKRPFSITSIDCKDERFVFTIPEGEKAVHVLPFAFTGERRGVDDNGSLHEKILIRTSLGETLNGETIVSGRIID